MGLLRMGLWCFAFGLVLGVFAQDDWEKAAELRQAGEAAKAEKLLKDYESPAGFESLNSTDKIRFLRGLLELAHLKAMRDDTTGALSLLNWAESRTDDYQRSIACIKYGEILLDMGEFERAGAYLKNADEIINKRVTAADTGAAIGQGGQQVDTGAAWRELRDQSDVLKAEVEAEEMKVKFGATYGSYVKLRRLQQLVKRSNTPRYRKEALKVADEIIETDPASQFAAAAGYLKGEIMASRLTENSPKKAIAETKTYLDKFVKERPDGLYRGEALMLLGKISLEIEWNAKEAEKYYTQALNYFRKAREKRDALSLYAAINDDLKNQSHPTQKPTSLNQWKLIIYHEEDPLKVYNIENAPLWYINDKEKNIYLVMGFFALSNGDSKSAKKYWEQVQTLDETVGSETSPYPTLMMRLISACRFEMFILSKEELALIKSDNLRMKLNYASLLYMLEHFKEADKLFENIFNSVNDLNTKALCMLCRGELADNGMNASKELAHKYYNWILDQPKLKSSIIYGSALFLYANTLMGTYQGFNKALPIYERYLLEYKNNNRWDYYRQAKYREIFCLILQKKYTEAKKKYDIFKAEREDGLAKELEYKFNIINQKGEYP